MPAMTSKHSEKRNHVRRKLIDTYMPTVRRIVLKYNRSLPPKIDVDDLVSAGVVGLLKSLERFDPDKGVDFKCFANYHIKGAIIDELRRWDHLSRGVRKTVKRIAQTHLQLEQQLKRQPTDEEVARAMKLPLEEYCKYESSSKVGFLSYEDHWDGEKAEDLLELIFRKELKLKLTRAVSRLPRKERVVIDYYYFKEKPMKDIAELLKISEGRVSQLHKQAMTRLKNFEQQLEQSKSPAA